VIDGEIEKLEDDGRAGKKKRYGESEEGIFGMENFSL
jgi:hypothetical protein